MNDTVPVDDDFLGSLRGIVDKAFRGNEPEVVTISVTESATQGQIYTVPIFGEEGKKYRQRGVRMPRELLVHPTDWKRIEKTLKTERFPADPLSVGRVYGIPVVFDE